jgi:glycosyltransferase involved in cell wall biosynthesis
MSTLTKEMIEAQQAFVSVIIPTYNAEGQIADCIRAIRNSDYTNYEIIVIDDCSDDGTTESIRDVPGRIFKTPERTGPAGARNLGIQHAAGDMLVFVDADIVVQPSTLRRLLESFLQRPDIVSVCGTYTSHCDYRNISSLYQKNYNEYKIIFLPPYGPYITTALFCIPRDTMKDAGGLRPDIYTGEDYELGLRLTEGRGVNFFNKSIRVTHNKHVTFGQLIRQKFQYATNLTMLKLELAHCDNERSVDLKRVFSIAIDQICAVLLSLPTAAAIACAIFIDSVAIRRLSIALLAGYCTANLRYWSFLFRNAGPLAIIFLPISLMEQMISQLAVIAGTIRFHARLPYCGFGGMT